jgi:hypothetical protein
MRTWLSWNKLNTKDKLSKMILLRRIDSTKMVVFAEAAYQSANRQDFPVLEMILWKKMKVISTNQPRIKESISIHTAASPLSNFFF